MRKSCENHSSSHRYHGHALTDQYLKRTTSRRSAESGWRRHKEHQTRKHLFKRCPVHGGGRSRRSRGRRCERRRAKGNGKERVKI